jgi:hypothetical protein
MDYDWECLRIFGAVDQHKLVRILLFKVLNHLLSVPCVDRELSLDSIELHFGAFLEHRVYCLMLFSIFLVHQVL